MSVIAPPPPLLSLPCHGPLNVLPKGVHSSAGRQQKGQQALECLREKERDRERERERERLSKKNEEQNLGQPVKPLVAIVNEEAFS